MHIDIMPLGMNIYDIRCLQLLFEIPQYLLPLPLSLRYDIF